jgi:hypothetical protein
MGEKALENNVIEIIIYIQLIIKMRAPAIQLMGQLIDLILIDISLLKIIHDYIKI